MNTHLIDAETVHNWRNRYHDKPYFKDLSERAGDAMFQIHDQHHTNGLNAAEAVNKLIEQFPEEFCRVY